MVAGTRSVEPPAARFHRHSIGEVELIAHSDGGLNFPTAMILSNVPPVAATRYNLPTKQTFLSYTILLVKTEDKLLLNDVRAGDFWNPGDKVFPGLDHTTSRTNLVVPSLKVVGIDPEDIEIVLITHAHPDQIGGLFDAEGNLALPNARYVAQKEWNHWMAAGPSMVEAEALRHHLELLIDEARRAFHASRTKSPLCRVARRSCLAFDSRRRSATLPDMCWSLSQRVTKRCTTSAA